MLATLNHRNTFIIVCCIQLAIYSYLTKSIAVFYALVMTNGIINRNKKVKYNFNDQKRIIIRIRIYKYIYTYIHMQNKSTINQYAMNYVNIYQLLKNFNFPKYLI